MAVVDRLGENATYSPQIQLIKGQALRTLEKFKEALAPLSVAAQGNPENIDTWLALGWCHKRTGRLDLAIEALEEALTVPLVDELSVWAFRAGVQGVKYNFNAYPMLGDATLRK